MINNPNQPDYTGASAQQYIDSYTNRPEDAMSIEGLQNLLGGSMSWKLLWEFLLFFTIIIFIVMLIKFTLNGYRDLKDMFNDE